MAVEQGEGHGALARADLDDVVAGPRRDGMHDAVDDPALVEEVLAEAGLAAGQSTPLVNMRLLEVKGRSVRDILARANAPAVDTLMEGEDEGGGLWAYRREYRSSYRAELGDAESLVSGQWFSDTTARGRERDDPVQISMELEVARELGVGLGDSLTWNVQGIRIHSVITSLREVQWARFEPNFFVLFAPGALDDAPQTWVTLVRATDPVVRGQVQRQLAERAANIATVDLGQVQQALDAWAASGD